jgi:hypothetical protein
MNGTTTGQVYEESIKIASYFKLPETGEGFSFIDILTSMNVNLKLLNMSRIVETMHKDLNLNLHHIRLKKVFSSKHGSRTVFDYSVFEETNVSFIFIKTKVGKIFFCTTDQNLLENEFLKSSRTIVTCLSDDNVWKDIPVGRFTSFGKNYRSIFPLIFFNSYEAILASTPQIIKIDLRDKFSFIISAVGTYSYMDTTNDSVMTSHIEEIQIYYEADYINAPTKKINEGKRKFADYINTFEPKKEIELSNCLKRVFNIVELAVEVTEELTEMIETSKNMEEMLRTEISSVCEFFYLQWQLMIPSLLPPDVQEDDNKRTTQESVEYLDSLLPTITNFKTSLQQSSSIQERMKLDPIVYLNVEGERICILKSTLQEMIPESQLTIRVASGRWEEPKESLDEDGNIIIEDVPSPVMKKVIEALRRKKIMRETNMKITANDPDEKYQLTEVLDFFLIENISISINLHWSNV